MATLPAIPADYIDGDTPPASEVNAWLATAREARLALATTDTATRHDARYEQRTLQVVANATDTKLNFPTAHTTSADVTASGTGNTDFLLNRVGLWRISASCRFLAGTTGERALSLATGTVAATLANRFAMDSKAGSTLPICLSVSTDLRIATTTTIIVPVYQNNGGNLNTDVAFGGTIHVALTWVRP